MVKSMSVHIGAKMGEIAPTVLMPGDPLRAEFIAKTYLKNPVCFNRVRGMYGFTGLYKGKEISVMGHGMGMPSIMIYATELLSDYGVKNIIRIGTCGGIDPAFEVGKVILANGAATDSNMNMLTFGGMSYAPVASYPLLRMADDTARKQGLDVHIGPVLTQDAFYKTHDFPYETWVEHGVHVVEMEVAALYTVASRLDANALAILTVSDNVITGEEMDSETRERALTDMIELALETGVSINNE